MDRHRTAGAACPDRRIGRFARLSRRIGCAGQSQALDGERAAACVVAVAIHRRVHRRSLHRMKPSPASDFRDQPVTPVVVLARQQVDPESGRRPRFFSIYLDPPTGAVLDKVDFRASWVGFLHVFHENLTIPQYSGRQIVGWAGVGMLILSLTGIWLWWPRRASVMSGLRWRRAPHTSTNLHHTLGFWISIPLAIVSLTGIYLSFPQTARSLMSSIAPMQPQPPRAFAAAIVEKPNLTPDEALRLAQAVEPAARPATLFLPTEPNRRPVGRRSRRREGRGTQQRRRQGTRIRQRARSASAIVARAIAQCRRRADHGHGGRPEQRRTAPAGSAGRQSRGAVDPMDP